MYMPMYVYYTMFSVQRWWQMNNVFDFFYIYTATMVYHNMYYIYDTLKHTNI